HWTLVSSAVTGGAAAVALRLHRAVVREETGRVRVAADAADAVAADTVRAVALVVAGRAALDVAAGGIAVERARTGRTPAGRMRVERAPPGGDPLVLVARLARRGRVAL